MTAATTRGRHRADGGFTLVEVTLTMMISGVLIAALATAISAAIRATPANEDRIDDARSTRALSTYLAQDTISTPPFSPEQDQGGFNVASSDQPDNNDCGAAGTNIVHMQWTETVVEKQTYVANYRFVLEDGAGRVLRVTCSADDGDPYTVDGSVHVTPKLRASAIPVATLSYDAAGNVTVVSFALTGQTGETVLIETASRNPSEFFPA
jgi:prepilin-type N-terminal cleavage/methylation domain-containing protein